MKIVTWAAFVLEALALVLAGFAAYETLST